MKKEEEEIITKNLHYLVTSTLCSDPLHAYLLEKNVLIQSEINQINSYGTPEGRAMTLYGMIRTKADSQNPFHHLIEGLKKTNQYKIVGILDPSQIPVTTPTKRLLERCEASTSKRVRDGNSSGVKFNVRLPVQHFTGRRRELDELHEKVGKTPVTVVTQITSVSGLGGIGKTQLVRQYIHERSGDFDENVIWLNAESDETLTKSFRTLAKDKLGISTLNANGGEKDVTTIVSSVYENFEGKRCLFVFDNVETGHYLQKFLPLESFQGGLSVLITTRDSNYNLDCGENFLKLREMEEDDAIAFVVKGLAIASPNEDTLNSIRALCSRLQFFPLALQQAISYIKEQQMLDNYSISNYLDDFEKYQRELLDSNAFQSIRNDYDKTTFTTWKMTVEKIEEDPQVGNCSRNMLRSMAYMSPEYIRQIVFLPTVPSGSERDLGNAFGLLLRYSMISRGGKPGLFSIHRLVQEVTRINLKDSDEEEPTISNLLGLLQANKYSDEFSLDHGLAAWSHGSRYSGIITEQSQLPSKLCNLLSFRARLAEAYGFATGAKVKLADVLSSDNENVYLLDCTICDLLVGLGKYDDAQGRLMSLLEELHSRPEKKIRMVRMHCESSLAELFKVTGQYEKALEQYLKILAFVKENLGEGHEVLAKCYHRVGLCLGKLERYEEAMENFQEGVKRARDFELKVDILLSSVDMHLQCENWERAAHLIEKLLDDRHKMGVELKAKVCYTGIVYLYDLGKLEEALKICDEILAEEVPPNAFQIFLDIGSRKGNILREQGKIAEASALHARSYKEHLKLVGEDNFKTEYARVQLALTWLYENRIEEAVQSLLSSKLRSLAASPREKSEVQTLHDKFSKAVQAKLAIVGAAILENLHK